ncbi:toxic anion resistance protein, partial [Abiotrophia sp.]
NLMLEQLYQKNKDYFEALNIYIAAGELKMQELQEEIIPAAIEKAKASGDQMDVQTVNDLNQFLDRLDKRTHDLRLTRQMTVQQAPQIRMIQNTNQALAEKIQVSVHTAIPLWENQVMIALTLLRQQNAAVSQRQVSQTTNDLLKRNADMLKQSAIDTARESERGVIDIETLQHTQNSLIETIEQTLEIQREGRRQRQIAEQELQLMEGQLRDKLMAISNEQQAYLEE